MKAALKEAANVVKEIAKKKNYRAKLAERVFVEPKLLAIRSDVSIGERPISVMTAQGPRTSLKRYEYADNVELEFTVKVLNDPAFAFGAGDLQLLLEYMQEGGVGSDRSQGAGTCEVVSVTELEPGERVAAATA